MSILGRVSEATTVVLIFGSVLFVDNESLVPSILLLIFGFLSGVISWLAFTLVDCDAALDDSRRRNMELRERNYRLMEGLNEIKNDCNTGNDNSDDLVFSYDSEGRINTIYRRLDSRGSYRVL